MKKDMLNKNILIGIIIIFIGISITPIINANMIDKEQDNQHVFNDVKQHILPCADVWISIIKPEFYSFKHIISREDGTWGLFSNIVVNNGEVSIISTCCPSLNKCLIGFKYENNETLLSLRIPLFYGKLEYLEEYGPKIILLGFALLPKLTLEI